MYKANYTHYNKVANKTGEMKNDTKTLSDITETIEKVIGLSGVTEIPLNININLDFDWNKKVAPCENVSSGKFWQPRPKISLRFRLHYPLTE